jgi:hypothetical protein
MIRPFGRLILTVGALALLASPALAQQQKGRGGFGMGMGGGAAILRAPNVQKDLKLSEEQVGKVQDVLRESFEKHQGDLQGVRDLPAEERNAKMQAVGKAINDEVKKGLSLSDEQSKRFDQIVLQNRGLQAFADPAVAEKLKLTDDQRSKIRELGQASFRGAGGAFRKDASKEDRAEATKKMLETRRENLAKVQAMLTDDQKKAWKELTGEPIEAQFPGGFGGRRPNNNN